MYIVEKCTEGVWLYLPCSGMFAANMRYYKPGSGIEAANVRETFPKVVWSADKLRYYYMGLGL
jgi:hypothetical protein